MDENYKFENQCEKCGRINITENENIFHFIPKRITEEGIKNLKDVNKTYEFYDEYREIVIYKKVEQITKEGAIQIFTELGGGMEEIIVGVVGVLQFEVLEHRLKNEYNVEIHKSPLPYQYIRWVKEGTDLKSLNLSSDTRKVQDLKGQPLLLFTNDWGVRWAQDKNKGLELLEFSKN